MSASWTLSTLIGLKMRSNLICKNKCDFRINTLAVTLLNMTINPCIFNNHEQVLIRFLEV